MASHEPAQGAIMSIETHVPSTTKDAAPQAPPKRSAAEEIKEKSQQLRGTIAEELVQDSDHFSDQTSSFSSFTAPISRKTATPARPATRKASASSTCYGPVQDPRRPDDGQAVSRHGRHCRHSRQRHAALHDAAGHPTPRRTQESSEGDHRRHQRRACFPLSAPAATWNAT